MQKDSRIGRLPFGGVDKPGIYGLLRTAAACRNPAELRDSMFRRQCAGALRVVGADDKIYAVDKRMPLEKLQRMRKHRLAVQFEKLFRHGAAHSHAASSGKYYRKIHCNVL